MCLPTVSRQFLTRNGGHRGTFGFRKRIVLQGGVAATVTPVALHCATKHPIWKSFWPPPPPIFTKNMPPKICHTMGVRMAYKSRLKSRDFYRKYGIWQDVWVGASKRWGFREMGLQQIWGYLKKNLSQGEKPPKIRKKSSQEQSSWELLDLLPLKRQRK